jgi:hypothetical protein
MIVVSKLKASLLFSNEEWHVLISVLHFKLGMLS